MFFMMERLFSFLPAVDESPGGEELNEPSAAQNHQGHEIQDRDAGARRTPVGLPRPLETAGWVPSTSDGRVPALDAEAFRSRNVTQRVDKSSATEPWQTLDEVQTARRRTERDKIDGEAPDGREERGGDDRFALNFGGKGATIAIGEQLEPLISPLEASDRRSPFVSRLNDDAKEELTEDNHNLKARLRKGELTNKEYQPLLTKNKKEVENMDFDMHCFRKDRLAALFPEMAEYFNGRDEIKYTEERILDEIIELFSKDNADN